jgi:hypothetical protein
MKDSKNIFKKLGLIGVGLCAACCLLPTAAVTFGVGALTVVSAYSQWIGIIATVIAVLLFGIYYFRKRQGAACDLDCTCNEEPVTKG